eukprot:777872-Alexandrium_andersonii.AAC.1
MRPPQMGRTARASQGPELEPLEPQQPASRGRVAQGQQQRCRPRCRSAQPGQRSFCTLASRTQGRKARPAGRRAGCRGSSRHCA